MPTGWRPDAAARRASAKLPPISSGCSAASTGGFRRRHLLHFRLRQLRCGGGFATALRLPVLEGRDGERSEEGHGTATDGALHRPTAEKGTSNRADPADFPAAKAAAAAAAGEPPAAPPQPAAIPHGTPPTDIPPQK